MRATQWGKYVQYVVEIYDKFSWGWPFFSDIIFSLLCFYITEDF